MSEPGAAHRRLRWRCRRGMLELDWLLQGFLDAGYAELGSAGQYAFEELLGLPDQDLLEYLMERHAPTDREWVHVIAKIRRAAQA